MPLARAEVTMSKSGDVPRDWCTNTVYHTIGTGLLDPTADWQNHANELAGVFSGFSGTHGDFSLYGHNDVTVKVYDMADAEPRAPKAIATQNPISPPDPSSEGPSQVAICLAYFCGRNLKHLRGRIFLGPLLASDINGYRPMDATLAQALVLAHNLFDIGGENVAHVLYRPKTHDTAVVTDYWAEDAWHIQRRRGRRSTKRVALHP